MNASGEFYKAHLNRFYCEHCESKHMIPNELTYIFLKKYHQVQTVCQTCATKLKAQGWVDLEHPTKIT